MKLIEKRYRSLKPKIEYLADEVVVAQAWKKTHSYIRNFNWYADTLALDVSALGIQDNAQAWAKQIKKGQPLHPLELVPAAKSEAWRIDSKGWHPTKKSMSKRNEGSVPLRPLAHLTVRDQTWCTAAMLCLADAVESAQRDCSHKQGGAGGALQRKVFSYGNRLQCDWKIPNQAWFRWGNIDIYRKFYTDYQNFLKRPIVTGRVVAEQQVDEESVYIVNLDLTKFYNNIDRKVLTKRLKDISRKAGNEDCVEFWKAFKKITDWQWADEDLALAKKHHMGDISKGLPQGLVAAGFFANAYLINFDKAFGNKINADISDGSQLVLHDYCRYVDDLRIVVSCDQLKVSEIAKFVNSFVTSLLEQHGGPELSINEGKTKVSTLSELDNDGSVSKRLEMVQEGLSGPADREMLDSASGLLESLLTVADNELPNKTTDSDSQLLQFTTFDHDIRADTLKRFAANRLESIVRSKRKLNLGLNDSSENDFENSSNESELLAKKLIFAWMRDPSLGLVLRKAIEIYPSADLFEPVFKAIFSRSSFLNISSDSGEGTTRHMMDYLLADLFRCAVDFNGYCQVFDYPRNVKPKSIIELISRYAQKVVATKNAMVFVKRQALILLAVVNKPVIEDGYEGIVRHHQILHGLLAGKLPNKYEPQFSALFEIAGQITDNFDTYATDYLEHIDGIGDAQYAALEVFAKRGGPFWLMLWKQLKKSEENQELLDAFKWAEPQKVGIPAARQQRLAKVIASDINGFEHESALIKLGLGLIELVDTDPSSVGSSPVGISVVARSSNSVTAKIAWSRLYKPEVSSVVCTKGKATSKDPRFEPPDWLDVEGGDSECEKIYWIGMILRAAAIGGEDFTGARWQASKTVT